MNLKARLAFVIVCVGLLGVVWFQNRKFPSYKQPDPSTPGRNHNIGVKIVPRLPESLDPSEVSIWKSNHALNNWVELPLGKKALDGALGDRRWNWKRPINFYGIVFDENGRPVSDAQVSCQWTDTSLDGIKKAELSSNDDGLFQLENKIGYILSVRVSKEGFYSGKESGQSFNFAEPWDRRFHSSDSARPVSFKLRQIGVAEPMIRRQSLRFSDDDGDGRVMIDLLGQCKADSLSDADLEIRMTHGPIIIVNGRREFDWEIEIKALDGGLKLYEEEFPFLAPEEGYSDTLRYGMEAKASGWKSDATMRFYFRLRGGTCWGRGEFRVSPFPEYGAAVVTALEYFLNPSGSRNLEFSPDLEVSEKFYRPEP